MLFLLLCALGWSAAATERAEYAGGTLTAAPRGQGGLDLTDARALLFRAGDKELRIAYGRVNLLEYGQQVDRRYAMAVVVSPLLLLSKKRAHFVTLGYTDEAGQQQAAVFRVHKNSIRAVLAALEARTGLKVQFSDAEARKARGR